MKKMIASAENCGPSGLDRGKGFWSMEELRRGAGPFFRAFCVTLALMGVVLSATLLLSRGQPAQQQVNQNMTVYIPEEQDRMNLLATISETEGSVPQVFVLYGFLPDRGQLALSLLPPKTVLHYWGTTLTLEEAWERGGTAYCAKVAAGGLGITIDHIAQLDAKGLEGIMDEVGLMDYDLPVSLDYPMGDRQVVMSKGNQQLDGRKIADILFYPAYEGGEQERSDRGVMLLCQLISRLLPSVLEERGDRLVTAFLNNARTDLSFPDYEYSKQAAKFLARQDPTPVTAVYVEGRLSKDYQQFYLTEGCALRLCQMFGGGELPLGASFLESGG